MKDKQKLKKEVAKKAYDKLVQPKPVPDFMNFNKTFDEIFK